MARYLIRTTQNKDGSVTKVWGNTPDKKISSKKTSSWSNAATSGASSGASAVVTDNSSPGVNSALVGSISGSSHHSSSSNNSNNSSQNTNIPEPKQEPKTEQQKTEPKTEQRNTNKLTQTQLNYVLQQAKQNKTPEPPKQKLYSNNFIDKRTVVNKIKTGYGNFKKQVIDDEHVLNETEIKNIIKNNNLNESSNVAKTLMSGKFTNIKVTPINETSLNVETETPKTKIEKLYNYGKSNFGFGKIDESIVNAYPNNVKTRLEKSAANINGVTSFEDKMKAIDEKNEKLLPINLQKNSKTEWYEKGYPVVSEAYGAIKFGGGIRELVEADKSKRSLIWGNMIKDKDIQNAGLTVTLGGLGKLKYASKITKVFDKIPGKNTQGIKQILSLPKTMAKTYPYIFTGGNRISNWVTQSTNTNMNEVSKELKSTNSLILGVGGEVTKGLSNKFKYDQENDIAETASFLSSPIKTSFAFADSIVSNPKRFVTESIGATILDGSPDAKFQNNFNKKESFIATIPKKAETNKIGMSTPEFINFNPKAQSKFNLPKDNNLINGANSNYSNEFMNINQNNNNNIGEIVNNLNENINKIGNININKNHNKNKYNNPFINDLINPNKNDNFNPVVNENVNPNLNKNQNLNINSNLNKNVNQNLNMNLNNNFNFNNNLNMNFNPNFNNKKTISKRGMNTGYDVKIKEGNRWIKVNKKPLPINKARQMGDNFVDNTISLRGKIVQSGRTQISDIPNFKFGNNYKVKANKKSTFFQEKRKYAINTVGEKQGLRVSKMLKRFR